MLNQIKYFTSCVIVTLSTMFIFNLEANNIVEEIPQSTFNIENINYNFKDIDWNNMFASDGIEKRDWLVKGSLSA